MSADRNLLIGILALQHNFINRDQLVAGLQHWVQQQSNSLAELLESNGALSPENRRLLEPLVSSHLAANGNDLQRAPSTLPGLGSQSTEPWERGDTSVPATLSFAPSSGTSRSTVGQSTGSGRFRILRFHAAGGLGQVSLAHDSELNRDVALKEIKPQYAAQSAARNRFLLEAEITGGLEHPGIVPVYSLGQYGDGRPYYAMRFIKGDTLKQAIERYHRPEPNSAPTEGQRTLELRKLLGRFIDVCQAVEYAHSRGVLHRDLKPGNVMLGNYGETLVVDWGLAKPLGATDVAGSSAEAPLQPASSGAVEHTETGDRLGTLQYMSPEQAAGQLDQLGPATDIFSLGATLYHLLTGQAMYTATDKDELLQNIAAARFPAPRTIRADIPKPLEAICLRALAARPADRYSSAQALLEDIECYLADEPVSAYREPLVVRARRWARKHPALVSGTLATVTVALLAFATGVVVLGQKNAQLAKANSAEQTERLRAERGERAAKLNEQKALQQEQIAKQNEAKAREEEAVATAVKNFLLNDLLALTEPELQAAARLTIDPDLKVKDLFRRASDRIDLQFDSTSPVAKELKLLVSSDVPPKLTVRELLLRASNKIAGRFEQQPQVEHDVRLAIGLAQRAVGEFARSVEHLERCRDLVSQLRGPEDPATLSALANLAAGYQIAGRSAEAIPMLEETLALRRKHLGPHHPQTLSSLNSLANSYRENSRLAEALPLLEENLKLRREHLGPDAPETLDSMENLASGYLKADRLREAAPLYTHVLARREELLGPEHPGTIQAVVNLAMTYRLQGQLPDAVAMLERALKLMQTQLGPDHPTTLSTMTSLGNAQMDLGRTAVATSLFKSVLELRETKLGPEHPLTLSSLRNLGIVYRRTDRPAEALPLFQRALKIRLETQGAKNPETLVEMSNVGDALADLGRNSEAIPLYQEALEQLKTVLGPDHSYTLLVTSNLAIEYRNADRLDEALPLLEQVLAAKLKKQGVGHPDTVRTLGSLAIAEAKLKKWSAAEQHFLTAWKAMDSFPAELRDQFRSGLGPEIVEFYKAWDKPQEAAEWQSKFAN
ncbi:tetratricopeptide repeat protein [Anatilimnocola sp. NA78]|uniref:serine/threonine-protein kinase n=1 Tax=Anatilimnocola sp. NA78 TaxID=3415683 RepID=UPI003CE56ABB